MKVLKIHNLWLRNYGKIYSNESFNAHKTRLGIIDSSVGDHAFITSDSDRIPQDPSYYRFADARLFFRIPNTLDVLSNLPFLIVGLLGFWQLRTIPASQLNIEHSNRSAYSIFFLGVALVCFGSAYFHWSPNNSTLLWDRLPMTIAFMALVSIIISEYISAAAGRKLLWPLLLIGALSVFYWWFTEQQGAGDLRFYAIVQFFPMLAIPIILLCFKSNYAPASKYWILIGTYVLAKLFEHFDQAVFDALRIVSGHSIKHIVPVIGIAILLKSYTSPTNRTNNARETKQTSLS